VVAVAVTVAEAASLDVSSLSAAEEAVFFSEAIDAKGQPEDDAIVDERFFIFIFVSSRRVDEGAVLALYVIYNSCTTV